MIIVGLLAFSDGPRDDEDVSKCEKLRESSCEKESHPDIIYVCSKRDNSKRRLGRVLHNNYSLWRNVRSRPSGDVILARRRSHVQRIFLTCGIIQVSQETFSAMKCTSPCENVRSASRFDKHYNPYFSIKTESAMFALDLLR
jgi:hypothetical protein